MRAQSKTIITQEGIKAGHLTLFLQKVMKTAQKLYCTIKSIFKYHKRNIDENMPLNHLMGGQ